MTIKNRYLINRGTPGWEIYYKEGNSNIELQEDTDWDSKDEPRFVDIHNKGAQDVTLEINDNTAFKKNIPSGYSVEALEVFPHIEKVSITASDDYILLIRK